MEETGDLNRRRRRERLVAAAIVAAAAIAVVALRVYNQYQTARLRSGPYLPKPERITPEIVLLQQYVRIDTSNPPGNEIAGARWLASVLQRNGVHPEIIESAPGRANLYARLKGRHSGEGLLLLNHIDVAPARKEEWSLPPFAGSIRLNMLYGRGAIDMKGNALCQVEAFLAVARSGRTPEHDLVFLATADEEGGSTFGTQWLLSHRPDVFEGVGYVLAEGGITEMQLEAIRYFGIETGSKQLTSIDLTAPTRERLQKTRLALEPHFLPGDPDRVLPGVRAYFHAVAPTRVENPELLVDIDRALAGGRFWLLPLAYRQLLQNNLWADGVRTAGGEQRMRVLLVNLPDEEPDRRIAWLRDIIRPFGATIAEVIRKDGPVPISSEATPLFSILLREIRRQYDNVLAGPVVLAGSTNDCRFLRPRDIECYGLQPFPVDFFQSASIHGVDERVRLDWLMEGIAVMRRIVVAYALPH